MGMVLRSNEPIESVTPTITQNTPWHNSHESQVQPATLLDNTLKAQDATEPAANP